MKREHVLIIRVKGGPLIGMGHLYRTMAIAEAAAADSPMVVLFVHNDDVAVSTVLSKMPFQSCAVDDLSFAQDAVQHLLDRYAADKDAVCIIDSKEEMAGEIDVLQRSGIPVLLLDNHTRARLQADANIYPVAHFDSRSLTWNGYTGEHLSGKEWVPISRRFLKARSTLKPFAERNSLLVTLGGADPNRITLKVMEDLRGFNPDVPILVILGPACSFQEAVHKKNELLGHRFTVIEQATNMEELMSEAGLAITALGTSIYELAYLGVPTIIISNYREDEPSESELRRLGFASPLGFHADLSEAVIGNAVEGFWNDIKIRAAMSRIALQTIDGGGAERIVEKAVGMIAGTQQTSSQAT
ncbi:MAG TPA: glycosyltransferase [Syntrophorhabdales bacterium]|nr:glycosyltransferase [Syntrophorhabdales bacterium]